eukprot:4035864-Ditylum_brightwellii.AAC.1
MEGDSSQFIKMVYSDNNLKSATSTGNNKMEESSSSPSSRSSRVVIGGNTHRASFENNVSDNNTCQRLILEPLCNNDLSKIVFRASL